MVNQVVFQAVQADALIVHGYPMNLHPARACDVNHTQVGRVRCNQYIPLGKYRLDDEVYCLLGAARNEHLRRRTHNFPRTHIVPHGSTQRTIAVGRLIRQRVRAVAFQNQVNRVSQRRNRNKLLGRCAVAKVDDPRLACQPHNLAHGAVAICRTIVGGGAGGGSCRRGLWLPPCDKCATPGVGAHITLRPQFCVGVYHANAANFKLLGEVAAGRQACASSKVPAVNLHLNRANKLTVNRLFAVSIQGNSKVLCVYHTAHLSVCIQQAHDAYPNIPAQKPIITMYIQSQTNLFSVRFGCLPPRIAYHWVKIVT